MFYHTFSYDSKGLNDGRFEQAIVNTKQCVDNGYNLRVTLDNAMLEFSEFENMLFFLGRLARVRAAILWSNIEAA